MSKHYFHLLFALFIFTSCGGSANDSVSDTTQEAVENVSDMEVESPNRLLSKNEITEFCELVANTSIDSEIVDSCALLIHDQIYFPTEFDSVHRAFNFRCSPNLENPHPTLDNYNSYDGDSLMWQAATFEFSFHEFQLVATVDGIGGVISTLETSTHNSSIQWPETIPDDFYGAMLELSKGVWHENKCFILADITVFVIESKNANRFLELAELIGYEDVHVLDENYELGKTEDADVKQK
jgi:hypothetical protein